MKKVLIDLDRLKNITTGLGHVAEHFGRTLANLQQNEFEFTYLVPKNYVGFFGDSVKYVTTNFKIRYFPEWFNHYDLWYTIHQDSNFYPSKKTPYVLIINDLNFMGEKSPSAAKKRLVRLQKKIDRAASIIVISKNTEQDLRKNCTIPNVPLRVIYCGVTVKTFSNIPKPVFAPEGDLLFSVGVVQPKKNYLVLIDFIKKIPANYKLVIAGSKSHKFASELETKIKEENLEDRIFLPGLISEEDKFWMYKNCKAVLFPSKFEGMGFPPIEAMRLGRPVFASTYSSIPEVSENHAYYWENFDSTYMSEFFLEKIKEFEADKNKSQIMYQHSLKYTWDENVRITLNLFRELLGMKF